MPCLAPCWAELRVNSTNAFALCTFCKSLPDRLGSPLTNSAFRRTGGPPPGVLRRLSLALDRVEQSGAQMQASALAHLLAVSSCTPGSDRSYTSPNSMSTGVTVQPHHINAEPTGACLPQNKSMASGVVKSSTAGSSASSVGPAAGSPRHPHLLMTRGLLHLIAGRGAPHTLPWPNDPAQTCFPLLHGLAWHLPWLYDMHSSLPSLNLFSILCAVPTFPLPLPFPFPLPPLPPTFILGAWCCLGCWGGRCCWCCWWGWMDCGIAHSA